MLIRGYGLQDGLIPTRGLGGVPSKVLDYICLAIKQESILRLSQENM